MMLQSHHQFTGRFHAGQSPRCNSCRRLRRVRAGANPHRLPRTADRPTAADGKSSEIAAGIAVDWINAGGGLLGQKVELIVYDDQGKADQSIRLPTR